MAPLRRSSGGAIRRSWFGSYGAIRDRNKLDHEKTVAQPKKSTIDIVHSSNLEDIESRIYEQIGSELESDNADKGTWTKAFAQAGGDDKQTRVIYIKLRAEKLISAERHRREDEAAERARLELEGAERLRLEQEAARRGQIGSANKMLAETVRNGNWLAADALLRVGVSPVGLDENGSSLLDIARKRKDQQMVQLLLEHQEVLPDPAKRSEYDSQRISNTMPIVDAPISETDKSDSPATGGAESVNLGAWRRFWARTLDSIVYQSVATIFFLIVPVAMIANLSIGSWLAAFWLVSLASWCFTESIALSIFGNTAGKAILGISLSKKDSKAPDFSDFLGRVFDVLLKGWALAMPLINLVAMLIAKLRLEEKGETSWDEKHGFKVTVRPINSTRYVLYVVVFLIAATAQFSLFKALEFKLAPPVYVHLND